MKKASLILFVNLIVSINVYAGFKKGNGGNSVVCPESTRLLDFYEAEILEGMVFKNDDRFWKTILKEKLAILASVDSKLAETYFLWLNEFEDQSLFLENEGLGKINDSLHVIIPAGCTVEQTINQQMTPLPVEKRYWIVKKYWDKLSNIDKAGIVFHEFTYRHLQLADSREVRFITAEMFSSK